MATGKAGNGKRGNGKSATVDAPVLVCGGAGFLGTHLCARLLDQGKRVICVDNFSTSEPEALRPLLTRHEFQLVRMHVAELDDERFEPVSAIYNLACAASPIHYQRSPLDTLFTSVNGTHRLLRLARRQGVRIFQASTSEIYGQPTVHPQTERYHGHVNTMGPRACYDEGKRCAETLCYIYHDRYGVPVRVGRIFNTYGPGMRMRDGRVVINFIIQALAGEALTIYGNGMQTRSFCYVDDLIEAIVRIMEDRNTYRGPINLGNPFEITVLQLAHSILRLTGSNSRIVTQPLPTDDPPRRCPDISVAKRLLDWQPATNLDRGLSSTIEDVSRRLVAQNAELMATLGPAHATPASRRAGVAGRAV